MPKFEDFDTDDLAGGAGSGGTASLFPEGLTFPNFNDDARASLAAIRRYAADTLMTEITTTGTSSAYTLTLTETLYTTLPGATDPHKYVIFNPHTDCADDVTLNVNATGAEQILDPFTGNNVKAGDLKQDRPAIVVRRPGTSGWMLASPGKGTIDSLYPLLAAANTFTASQEVDKAGAFGELRAGSDVATASTEMARFALFGHDDGGNDTDILQLRSTLTTVTDTAEDGQTDIYNVIAGALTRIARLEQGLALGSTTSDPGVDGGLAAQQFYEDSTRFFPQRLPFACATVNGSTVTGYGISSVGVSGNVRTVNLDEDQGAAANYAAFAHCIGGSKNTAIFNKTSGAFQVVALDADSGSSTGPGTDWSVMCFKTTGTLE